MTTQQQVQAQAGPHVQTALAAPSTNADELPIHPLVCAWHRKCNTVRFLLETVNDHRKSNAAKFCKIGSLRSDPSVMVVVRAAKRTHGGPEALRYWTAIPDQYQHGVLDFKVVRASDVNHYCGDVNLNKEDTWHGVDGVYRPFYKYNDWRNFMLWIISSSIKYAEWLEIRISPPDESDRTKFVEYLEAKEYFARGESDSTYVTFARRIAWSFYMKVRNASASGNYEDWKLKWNDEDWKLKWDEDVDLKWDELNEWRDKRWKMECQYRNGLYERMDREGWEGFKVYDCSTSRV